MLFSRRWGKEKLLSLKDLAASKELPVERSYWTWRNWLRRGLKINGRLVKIPQKDVQGTPHTSAEAVWEAFDGAELGDVPQKRAKRSRG